MRISNRGWVVAFVWLVSLPWIGGTVVVTHPYRGVTLTVRSETSPRAEHINVMQIDLTQPGLRFLVTNGNTPVDSTNREVTAAKTLDYMTSQNGQIAINAHFYQPNSTDANRWVCGMAASQGYVYSSFEGSTPATANPVNSLTLTQDYAIMTHAPALNIDALNHAQIVHYDAGFPDKKHVLEAVTLYNAVSGSAQIVTNGVKTIPTYTGNVATGLISNGTYSDANSWYNGIRARTAIGLTADNHTLVLFTIDEAGGSSGMTVGEVADMLRVDYGVWNALNLDGGGSTTLALQDPVTHVRSVINSSSNGASPRIVATSLVVFADPEIAVEQPAGTNLIDGSASINLGGVNLGGTSGTFIFTVRNTGAGDLTGLAVTKTGTNAGEFTVGALGATTLVPNTSTSFAVTFAPGAAGSRTAALHIASNDADENPFDIYLTGTGVAVPEIAVEQPAGTNLTDGSASINLGGVNLGGTSGTFIFTVRNTGAGDLTGLAVTKTGANAGEFTVGALGATTLVPNTNTSFAVTFAPGAAGPRTAALHLASNDADENPFDIDLTGTGVATALQTWRQTHFGSPENMGEGADLNDYDKDGLPNLIEYAFGLDPKQNSAGMLPQPQIAGSIMTIRFTEPAGVSGVLYGAESSETLRPGSWMDLPDLGTPPQHTFNLSIGIAKFMRLTVTSP